MDAAESSPVEDEWYQDVVDTAIGDLLEEIAPKIEFDDDGVPQVPTHLLSGVKHIELLLGGEPAMVECELVASREITDPGVLTSRN